MGRRRLDTLKANAPQFWPVSTKAREKKARENHSFWWVMTLSGICVFYCKNTLAIPVQYVCGSCTPDRTPLMQTPIVISWTVSDETHSVCDADMTHWVRDSCTQSSWLMYTVGEFQMRLLKFVMQRCLIEFVTQRWLIEIQMRLLNFVMQRWLIEFVTHVHRISLRMF